MIQKENDKIKQDLQDAKNVNNKLENKIKKLLNYDNIIEKNL